MATMTQALQRVADTLNLQLTLRQRIVEGNPANTYFLDKGGNYVPHRWQYVSASRHGSAGKGCCILQTVVDSNNLFVEMGSGFTKITAFDLINRGCDNAVFYQA